MDYSHGVVWIQWFGTHAEYDHVDANTVETDF
ncbi:MAG: type II toxin-antitoxin system HigB family toxin [Deltaproteobacteria bacterium]|nr:type II toxin-antitoxin system HigB family toxin [Deltaproteobacteria bacterium]